MLKALFRKQFLEINQFYFVDRRTGKAKNPARVTFTIVLFVAMYFASGFAFMGISAVLSDGLIAAELDWLFFALIASLTIIIGTLGSVLQTYTSLFKSKDTELLLSLPVPTWQILLVRMSGVFAAALVFSAVVWCPSCVEYGFAAARAGIAVSPASIACMVALLLVQTLIVSALTCAMGWIVVAISSRVKNKAVIVMLLTAGFLFLYYFVYFQIVELLQKVVAVGDELAQAFSLWVWPLYQMGLAATGDGIGLVFSFLFAAAVFALTYSIMTKSFVRLSTREHSHRSASAYSNDAVKTTSVEKALLQREFRHLLSSPVYLTNCGIGIIVFVALAVAAVINQPALSEFLVIVQAEAPVVYSAMPAIGCVTVLLVQCMTAFTAPSVSLEGKTLWVVRSLPIDTWKVLKAKEQMHVTICSVPAFLSTVVILIVLGADPVTSLIGGVCAWMFVWLSAAFGLFMNLKNPNLTWTNETAPVKQSLPVFVHMFGGWLFCVAVCLLAFLACQVMPAAAYLALVSALFAGVTCLLQRWIKTEGVRLFEAL